MAPALALPLRLQLQGMDRQLALYQVANLNVSSFFGRTIPNFAGDKVGRFHMSIVAYLTCAVLCFCWTAAKSTAGAAIFEHRFPYGHKGIASRLVPETTLIRIRSL